MSFESALACIVIIIMMVIVMMMMMIIIMMIVISRTPICKTVFLKPSQGAAVSECKIWWKDPVNVMPTNILQEILAPRACDSKKSGLTLCNTHSPQVHL